VNVLFVCTTNGGRNVIAERVRALVADLDRQAARG
jgi:protein-tyrosine-phosphatase